MGRKMLAVAAFCTTSVTAAIAMATLKKKKKGMEWRI